MSVQPDGRTFVLEIYLLQSSRLTILFFIFTSSAPTKHRLRSPNLELNSGQKRRARRSVSTEKNVEMLMVADQTMYAFYKDGLEEYLLTIANMVCMLSIYNGLITTTTTTMVTGGFSDNFRFTEQALVTSSKQNNYS